jgi:hypothetical protein
MLYPFLFKPAGHLHRTASEKRLSTYYHKMAGASPATTILEIARARV